MVSFLFYLDNISSIFQDFFLHTNMLFSRYMDALIKIFQATNGDIRLRLIRFFLANPKANFKLDDIEFNTKVRRSYLKKDLTLLTNAGFLDKGLENKNTSIYKLNHNFPYNSTLYDLVFDFQSLDKSAILSRFKKIGRIKLFSFTGVFIDDQDVDLDILVVGDNLKAKEVSKVLNEMDALFASKLRILVIDLEEFDYRKKMFDRFLHIVLDSERITLIDKVSDRVI